MTAVDPAVVIATLRSVAAEILDPAFVERSLADIGPDTVLADLGIDSIAVAEIVLQLEDKLGVEIPASRWIQIRTLRDLIDSIGTA